MTRRQLLCAALGAGGGGGDPLGPAAALLDRAVAAHELGAAVLHVRAGAATHTRAFGLARNPDTVFLLASITKPMTAAGVMTLVERGQLALDDPLHRHLPGFEGGDRALVTVRHLLTHTSGLPDMLPDNTELRRRHAPLSEFVAGACKAPLLFRPGSKVKYQSMGFLLAAEIVQRLTKKPFPEFLARALFAPLGMKATALGLGGHKLEDTARCQVPDEPGAWNSPYWRALGSPWGGAHAPAADVARLLQFFAHPAGPPLRAETVKAMLTPQDPPGAPAAGREHYGLGWRLGIGGRGASPRTFGHSGATGTLAWMDPARELTCVLLTTWPSSESRTRLIEPVSDLVSQAF